jgi:hypothetical protein
MILRSGIRSVGSIQRFARSSSYSDSNQGRYLHNFCESGNVEIVGYGHD